MNGVMARAFLAGGVAYLLDERRAVSVLELEDLRRDLDEVRVELT